MQQQRQEKVYRTELTPGSFLRRSAYVFPDKGAVVYGDRRYTYKDLEERVNRLASRLRDAGFQKGDRIAFLCPNIPPMLEGTFAIPAAGLVMVPINILLSATEVEYIIGHSESKMVCVDAALEELLEGVDEGVEIVRIDDTGEEGDPYEDYLAGGSPEPIESVLEDEEETISINYTSGTTGNPKGVMYSHRGAYLNALAQVIEAQMNYETRYLWTLPMFHCNGWCYSWAVTAVAATHVCLRQVDPARIWELFESENITHYCGAPTVQIPLANAEEAHELDREIITMIGGSPPSPALLKQFRALNIRPIHLYGLTETYGPNTILHWRSEWNDLAEDEQAEVLARQGQAHVTANLARVVDDDMNDIPKDGETKEAFEGGWFHSEDLGVWHTNEDVEVRDRDKDVIISGGENISSVEVEQLIEEHPAVMEAAVTSMPDEQWGERPKAFVTLNEGEEATEDEIIDFVKEHVASFKAPDTVEFGELPKTATGKIQKYVLREQEWEGEEKRIG
jgi:fatty-acyl-CoA synthase